MTLFLFHSTTPLLSNSVRIIKSKSPSNKILRWGFFFKQIEIWAGFWPAGPFHVHEMFHFFLRFLVAFSLDRYRCKNDVANK